MDQDHASLTLLAMAAEKMSDAVMVADADGVATWANESFLTSIGLRRDEVVGKSSTELLDRQMTDAKSMQRLEAAMREGAAVNLEVMSCKRDRDTIWSDLAMTAVENDTGQIASFIFVERDVTERIKQSKILSINEFHLEELVDEHTAMLEKQAVRLQKALRRERDANELHRKFVTMTSHEFRTPLAIIDGEARRIFRRAEMIDQEEIAARMRKIRNAVDRMTRLMESILTVARLEAGKVLIEPVACDPRETLMECCETQREISPQFEIVLECAGMEPTIVADPATLEQVVTNLLSNAVKYSVNSPRIEVRGWTETPDVVIQVRDFGVGIDVEDLPKIFDRFFRAKTAGGIAGTGIGLNLIKTLIEQHEGTICATSVEGEGSTFTLRLPIDGPSRDPGT